MNIVDYLDYVGDEWAKGWIQRQKTEDKGVWVSNDYMDIVGGNPYDAMVLAQVLYWHGIDRDKLQPRISHQHKNHLWIVKTYKEWADDLRFNSDRTVKQCFVRLTTLGVIIKEKHKSPYHGGQIALYVRVNWPCFKQLISALNKSVGGTPDVQPGKTSNVQPEGTPDVQPGKTSNVSSLPESTKKNTSKTTYKEVVVPPVASQSPAPAAHDDDHSKILPIEQSVKPVKAGQGNRNTRNGRSSTPSAPKNPPPVPAGSPLSANPPLTRVFNRWTHIRTGVPTKEKLAEQKAEIEADLEQYGEKILMDAMGKAEAKLPELDGIWSWNFVRSFYPSKAELAKLKARINPMDFVDNNPEPLYDEAANQ